MEKKKTFGLILTLVLILLGTIAVGAGLRTADSALSPVVKLGVYTIACLYVICDFRIPHSNTFKYVMLIFGLSLATSVLDYAKLGGKAQTACMALCVVAVVLVGYMSGRLNKFSQNKLVMFLAFALFTAAAVTDIVKSGATGFIGITGRLSDTITWLVFCTAYVTRFSDHKEAGEIADESAADAQ